MVKILRYAVLVVTGSLVIACGGMNSGESDLTTGTCDPYNTAGLGNIRGGETPLQKQGEQTLRPNAWEDCDESVQIINGQFDCVSSIVSSFPLSVADGGAGFTGPVTIEVFSDHLRIIWDETAGHVLVVNHNQFAYIDGIGLALEGKTVPTATILNYADWEGSIHALKVCGWKL